MPHPLRSSISRQLTTLALSTSFGVLMLACAALFVFQIITFRASYRDQLHSIADLMDQVCTPALVANDPAACSDSLEMLHSIQEIVGAQILLEDNTAFASFGRFDTAKAPPRPDEHFTILESGGVLTCAHNLSLKDKRLGTLYLQSDFAVGYRHLFRREILILLGVFTIATLLTMFMARQLQRPIAEPILKLADLARRVAEKRDYTLRAEPGGGVELGTLIRAFNAMLGQIQLKDEAIERSQYELETNLATIRLEVAERERAQAGLLEAERKLHSADLDLSRQAGRAEVATAVLHNVGNVLNSVNVSTALIEERIRASRISHVSRIAALLRESAPDLGGFFQTDPRGRRLPEFIDLLAQQLVTEQQQLLDEAANLTTNVQHIKDIVARQQSLGRVAGVLERLSLAALMDQAIAAQAADLAQFAIDIERDYEPLPEVTIDKQQVLQILINLVSNAREALAESPADEKTITVRITRVAHFAHIIVTDNGIGIPAENLTRIFAHGFTTRKDGHGFGLHSGALAATALGGSLIAESDGIGLGARFTLALPLQFDHNVEQTSVQSQLTTA